MVEPQAYGLEVVSAKEGLLSLRSVNSRRRGRRRQFTYNPVFRARKLSVGNTAGSAISELATSIFPPTSTGLQSLPDSAALGA